MALRHVMTHGLFYGAVVTGYLWQVPGATRPPDSSMRFGKLFAAPITPDAAKRRGIVSLLALSLLDDAKLRLGVPLPPRLDEVVQPPQQSAVASTVVHHAHLALADVGGHQGHAVPAHV